MLGTGRLFIEFDVIWNEWLDAALGEKTKINDFQQAAKNYLEAQVTKYDRKK